MKKTLFILAISTFAPHLGYGSEGSSEEMQLGRKTTQWEHLFSEDFSEGDLTVRCGSPNRKTGDISCCTYKDDVLVNCSIR